MYKYIKISLLGNLVVTEEQSRETNVNLKPLSVTVNPLIYSSLKMGCDLFFFRD